MLQTKYKMLKTSSTDRINTAFEEKGKTLNNPKIQEGFLNGNKENEIINELVEMFDKNGMKKRHITCTPMRLQGWITHQP